MRTLDLRSRGIWSMLESAVVVVPHDKARFVYIDNALFEAFPALALPSGIYSPEAVFKQLFGHLKHHVAEFEAVDPETGKSIISRIETHTVANIEEVAIEGTPIIVHSSIMFLDKKGKVGDDMPNADGNTGKYAGGMSTIRERRAAEAKAQQQAKDLLSSVI